MKHWSPALAELTYLNVGTGVDLSIRELANMVAMVMDFRAKILWHASKLDGAPKNELAVSRPAKLDTATYGRLERYD